MLISVPDFLESCMDCILAQFSLWMEEGEAMSGFRALELGCPCPPTPSSFAVLVTTGGVVVCTETGVAVCAETDFIFFGFCTGALSGRKLPTTTWYMQKNVREVLKKYLFSREFQLLSLRSCLGLENHPMSRGWQLNSGMFG